MAPFHPKPPVIPPIILPPGIPAEKKILSILIDMLRFKEVACNEEKETVEVGAGCLWSEVYTALEKHQRNAVGGSGPQGVGVAGFLMGGGYSFPKTNQFGLGIDNVTGYEVVLPSGDVKNALPDGDTADLFNALRGGGANFAIVTKFILKTHKQAPNLWSEKYEFPYSMKRLAKALILDWVENERRPHTAMVAAFRYDVEGGELKFKVSVLLASDGEVDGSGEDHREKALPLERSAGDHDQGSQGPTFSQKSSFAEVDALFASIYGPNHTDTVRGVIEQRRNLDSTQGPAIGTVNSLYSPELSLALKWPEEELRGRFGCIMVHRYTRALIDEIDKQAEKASLSLKAHSGRSCLIDVWPFLPSIFDNSPKGAAWPHEAGDVFGPCLASFRWMDATEDEFWLKTMQDALDGIYEVAKAEGVTRDDAPVYLNTSLETTPVDKIYRGNLEHLEAIRAKYDPDDVMSLTGGFNISLPPKK